jgi:predicted phosphodiesterase
MRLAVIADVHGNLLALDAVLRDLDGRGGADLLVNLGDCVSGPLWPAETLHRLRSLRAVTVRGNHDRIVAFDDLDTLGASDRFAHEALTADQRAWLGALPQTASVLPGLLAFHATPAHDETYLIEEVCDGRLMRSGAATIAARLGEVGDTRIALCGHSHQSHVVRLPSGVVVLNPGSVGCPAYHDPTDPEHVSEAGSPHARYALLDLNAGSAPTATLVAVTYASEEATRRAELNGRPDWAEALRTGFMGGTARPTG